MRRKLSCFVIACNEVDRIEVCLKSLAGWVDQLIVLDSGSTDGTVEIAEQYADKVYKTDWPGYGAQRNRGLQYCEHDWVLSIDADEEMTPELRAEVDKTLSTPELSATMIKFPWRTFLFGKPLKYGRYSTPQAKLFTRVGAQFVEKNVHEKLLLPEYRIKVLRSPLNHYSWRDYHHVMDKHLRYGILGASDKLEKGKTSSIGYALFRAGYDFLVQYVLRLGFLDGTRGLLMAIILSQYAFHKYAALWTLHQKSDLPTFHKETR